MNFKYLKNLHILVVPQWTPWIIEVNWMPPHSGWIKVHRDGVAFESLGLFGCVGLFVPQDHLFNDVFASCLGSHMFLR